jgi:peroxiredoxin
VVNGVGKKIDNFSLPDPRAKATVSLTDFKDKKAVIVLFVGTECPINNAFLPTLVGLHKEYADKGVQLLGINANVQDAAERVAEHAKKTGLPFPVLKDDKNVVADRFGARRTPEAFVLDAEGKVRYQGRIDDQFGLGYNRPKPTRRDLATALDELLAGKPVSQPTVEVAGCLIGRVRAIKDDGAITYAKHVSRIVQNRCQECHRPGQIGPMPFQSYRDLVAWADTIKEVVSEDRMPPWYADPKHSKAFKNDRSLSKEEKDTLLAWIDQGCPKGDDKDLPPKKEFYPGWTIGKPDAVYHMEIDEYTGKPIDGFEVPADAGEKGVPYKYFRAKPNFKEDKWVVRAEAKADAAAVVHHIIVFVVPPTELFMPGRGRGRVLVGTAPGDMPLILPDGVGKRIPAGYDLVFQMHYTPNGKAQKDRSSVGLVFADKEPERECFTLGVLTPPAKLVIPAGADNHPVESSFEFPEDGQILGFMPHMHLRGKDFMYEKIAPDGTKETLLTVPRYNFNWQSSYRLKEWVPMPKGSKIHCVAHFDNSAKNPNNPDPTREVRWGDQTWEEMMIGWAEIIFDRKPQ